MKRLRHPIRAIREPFGKAGLIVACVALIAAVGGTAWAATKLNNTQKKEVEKIATKYAGKPGAEGPAGKEGPQGKQGEPGIQGATGDTGLQGVHGKNVLVGAATAGECASGGTTVEVEGEAATKQAVCDGAKGSAGSPGESVTIASASAGECSTGGSKFSNGIGSGHVCNGAAGANGKNVAVGTPSAGECATGGATVEVSGESTTKKAVCNGTAGINGNTVLNGTANPGSAVGSNGDFYINTTTDELWGPKAGGAWPGSGVSLKGASGNTILSAAHAPASNEDNNGDFYIDTSTYEIYGPKTAGAWGSGSLLAGGGIAPGSITTADFAPGAEAPNAAKFDGLEPDEWQLAIEVTCAAGEAVTAIEQDGGATCEPVSGGGSGTVTKIKTGAGLEGGPITGEGELKVNFAETQKRVTGECSTGQAVKKVEEDGTVVCASAGESVFPTLPSGKTETGVWTFGQVELEANDFVTVPLPFALPVKPSVPASNVIYQPTATNGLREVDAQVSTHCPGSGTNPEAAAGYLCVYSLGVPVGVKEVARQLFPSILSIGSGTNVSPGATLEFRVATTGLVSGKGTYAVTAR